MPFSSIGSSVSDRSHARSSQDSRWFPKIPAHSAVAPGTSSSGAVGSLARNTGSVK